MFDFDSYSFGRNFILFSVISVVIIFEEISKL